MNLEGVSPMINKDKTNQVLFNKTAGKPIAPVQYFSKGQRQLNLLERMHKSKLEMIGKAYKSYRLRLVIQNRIELRSLASTA